MSGNIMGLIVSAVCVVLLLLLYRFEEHRNLRFLERARLRADLFIVSTSVSLKNGLHFLSKDFIQQTFHYIFHTFLKYLILGIHKIEQGVRTMMHVNKTIAKKAERDSASRSKLDEMTIHKVATALTDEEKRIRKEKSLSGK